MGTSLGKTLVALVMIGQTIAIPTSRMDLLDVQPLSRSPSLLARQDDDANDANYFDATDLSNINTLAAIGDSYSAGIGAGNRLGSITSALDPQSDWACSRYDHSYPYLVSQDPRLSAVQKFQFLSCSGATTADVLQHQIPNLDSNQNAIMLSIGGNDVELVKILNQCIFQFAVLNPTQVTVAQLLSKFDAKYAWAKDFDWEALGRGCEAQLDRSASLIASSDFSDNLREVMLAAQGKLADSGKLYVTGYAKFFAEDLSTACDTVSWSTWIYKASNLFQPTQYLTKDNRQKMNDLVYQVNLKLMLAARATSIKVVFVDYDPFVGQFGGRYCQAGVDESTTESNTRTGLMFYELNTLDPLGQSPWKRTNDDPLNGTFDGTLDVFAQITMDLDPGSSFANQEGNTTATDVSTRSLVRSVDSTVSSRDEVPADENEVQVPNLLPDGYGRVFHPQILLHELIANRVIYEMMNTNEMQHGFATSPLNFTISSCPAATLPPDPPGGFAQTCGSYYLDGHYLNALCRDHSGSFSWQQEDLNLCLINSHGTLVNQDGGNFFGSCSNCVLPVTQTATLSCNCVGADITSIYLNNFISNVDGKLVCSGHISGAGAPRRVS